MLLSRAIRHCLLPGFSRAIEAIFADCYDETLEATTDPVELIDRRSREAATRLKLLIGDAFAQIYHQLLVVGLEELLEGGGENDKADSPRKDKEGPQDDSVSPTYTFSLPSLNDSNESFEEEEEEMTVVMSYEDTLKWLSLYDKRDRRKSIRKSSKHLKGSRNHRKRYKFQKNQNQSFQQLEQRSAQRQQEKEKEKKEAKARLTESSFTCGFKSSQRVRKLVALVVSRAMAAAIAPDMERLVWTLRNDHVAQLRPEAVKPVEMLMRSHQTATHKGQNALGDEGEDELLDADSANTLYGHQREPFRRAVYETFFADPTRSPEPLTLTRKPSSNALEGTSALNVSRLQRHLLAAVAIAVRSGFLLFLDQQIVLEIGAKFDIRMERRRHLDGEFSFIEFSSSSNLEAVAGEGDGNGEEYLEDDDESVTINPAFVSPLKSKFFNFFCFLNITLILQTHTTVDTANILALRRTVDMWTSETIFGRLLERIFAPLKKMKMEHFHPQTGRSTVDGTELIDARIGRAAVHLKRYFLRTVGDILLAVFQHMAAYVAVMRRLADADAEADVPTGMVIETAIPTGNGEFEALFKVHVEQTLVDYRNVLVAELDRKPAKSRAELAKLWYSGAYEEDGPSASSTSILDRKNDKKKAETAQNPVLLGEAVTEAVEMLQELLREMYNVSEDKAKRTAWKVYVADMREITVGERSLVIAFAENLRHLFLGAFNNELRWELIVKGVEIQRYDEDEDEVEEEEEEEEENDDEVEKDKSQQTVEGHHHHHPQHQKCSEKNLSKSKFNNNEFYVFTI